MEIKLKQSNVVGWFELYVADLARAKAFYQDVFQHPLEDLPAQPGSELQMCAFPMLSDSPGAAGALVKSPHMGPGSGGTLVYFSCIDCAVESERAAAYGGALRLPKMGIGPYGFIALVEDTEGNLIGLHSLK
jgi:predicted enzyme related to lactoylglutathione lyase